MELVASDMRVNPLKSTILTISVLKTPPYSPALSPLKYLLILKYYWVLPSQMT